MKPFRFGASIANARSAAEWRETARKVEDWGYATLLLPDHFVVPLSPIPALAVAAEAAHSLRVGTMVAANDFRHPAMLAKEVATLDLLTDGRVELGIGAGWHAGEYEAVGISYDPAWQRVERLGEALRVIKRIWTEDTATYGGDHYRVTELPGLPRPIQKPHPPIMIGGGAKALLSLAAREADIISLAPSFAGGPAPGVPDLSSLTVDGVTRQLGWIKDAAGDRWDALELSAYYSGRGAVTDDPAEATAAALRGFAERTGAEPPSVEEALASPQFLFGTVDQLVDLLTEYRERFDISYIVVTEEMVEPFAPVVRALAGVAP